MLWEITVAAKLSVVSPKTMNEEKVQQVKEVLLKYLLPDCLKPEYDGMTADELSRIIIREYERD